MTTNAYRLRRTCQLATLCVGLWVVSQSASAACLRKARPLNEVTTLQIFMLAPEQEVAEYESLGFSRVACPTDLSVVRAYVERLCDGAPRGSLPPLNTDVAIGRPRERACASARAGLAEAGG